MATMSDDRIVDGRFFKPNPKKQPYEVFFPGQFTRCQPWGSRPEEEWKEIAPCFMEFRDMGRRISPLSFCLLSHETHSKEALEIDKADEDDYVFAPQQKFGKPYYPGSYICLTHSASTLMYRKVPATEAVLPGLYSWWGIKVSEIPRISTSNDKVSIQVADYLDYPPDSRYGTHQFTINIVNLLVSYAWSRSCELESVRFKVGGTLRYKQEICYVIIICLESDHGLGEFPNASPETLLPLFDLSGLIKEDGKVCIKSGIVQFRPQYVIKSLKIDHMHMWDNFSWEVPAFAFHFPRPVLRCSKQATCTNEIRHTGFCVPHFSKCPDRK